MADYSLSYTGNQINTALGEVINNQVVKTSAQSLADAGKTQARSNIGAAAASDVSGINTKIGSTALPTTAQTITGAIAEHETDISGINTSLNGKVPTSRTINGKALTSNITINAAEVPYSNSLIAAINTVKDALDTALGGISKIFFVDEDRNIDYDLSIKDGYFYINLVS